MILAFLVTLGILPPSLAAPLRVHQLVATNFDVPERPRALRMPPGMLLRHLTIKAWMGATHFLCRRLPRVSAEMMAFTSTLARPRALLLPMKA